MQMKYLVKNDVRKNHLLASEITSKKVDINVLLNKVKIEKKRCDEEKNYNFCWSCKQPYSHRSYFDIIIKNLQHHISLIVLINFWQEFQLLSFFW